MKKTVIIINGRGGVGKDTLCDFISGEYSVMNISSITPVKEIAVQCGWKGEKDDRSRKFLSDLKQLLADYNDYPTRYLLEQYRIFLQSDCLLLFVQIREGMEIDKFKSHIEIPCVTLLITSSVLNNVKWGNHSDDEVEAYEYDYIYDNSKSKQDAEQEFKIFISDIINEVKGE